MELRLQLQNRHRCELEEQAEQHNASLSIAISGATPSLQPMPVWENDARPLPQALLPNGARSWRR